MGEDDLADELKRRHETARAAMETTFWDPDTECYAINVRPVPDGAADGTGSQEGGDRADRAGAGPAERAPADAADPGPRRWQRNTAWTAMQAVPLLLDAADPARGASWLDAVAGNDFTAPWGVRMLPESDPEYDPESYHGGAVWPLYTGWVSWAEYAAGRTDSAFRHWMMNVEQVRFRARGAWDEVLSGAERRGRGVCPDQAWSTAMTVAPLVYGLLGAEPDAAAGRLRLRPQIPGAWDRLDVGLRIAEARVALSYRREGARRTYRLNQERGPVPLTVVLEPLLPPEAVRVTVDGQAAELDARAFGPGRVVPVQVVLDAERVITFQPCRDGGDPTASGIQ